MIAYGAAKHGIAGFESVEDRPLRDGAVHFKLDLSADAGEVSEVIRENDADHEGGKAETEEDYD